MTDTENDNLINTTRHIFHQTVLPVVFLTLNAVLVEI
jgi:hypothetical protein